MSKEKLAVLCALLAGPLWALLGISVRVMASYNLSSIQIVVTRLFSAAIVMGIFMFIKNRQLFRIEKKDVKLFFALALACILVYNLCFAITVQLASISLATGLLYTSPIWAMLVSYLVFHEALTRRKLFSIALNFVGCALMCGLFTGFEQLSSYLGILTGILAGVGYGCYGIFVKLLNDRYHSLTITFYTFCIAGTAGLLVCRPVQMVQAIALKPEVLLIIFLVSITCCISPYMLFNFALSYIEASRAALIVSFELVAATVFGILLYQEPLTVPGAIGIVCILTAIVMSGGGKEPDTPEPRTQ